MPVIATGTGNFRREAVRGIVFSQGFVEGAEGRSWNTRFDLIIQSTDFQMMHSRGKPNILLISLDAVRADHLSCYGYERETTPFLKALSEKCLLCENAYSASNWTLPSHVSIFSGLPMGEHGVGSSDTGLRHFSDPRLISLAEYLRSQHYRTAAFTNCAYLSRATHFDRGFEQFQWMEEWIGPEHPFYTKRFLGRYWGRALNRIYSERLYRRSDQGAAATLRQFQDWLQHTWDRRAPFFTFMHLFEAHAPYQSPQLSHFGRIGRKDLKWIEECVNPWPIITGRNPLREEHLSILRDVYDGALLYLDQILESLFHFLENQSLLDETICIITADHGEGLGEARTIGHAGDSLREAVTRIPLIIHFPETAFSRRVGALTSHLDILPTIQDLAGSPDDCVQPQIRGFSLVKANPAAADRTVVSESLSIPMEQLRGLFPGVDLSRFDRRLRAVRWSKYKLVWNSHASSELYDLEADPAETKDLSEALPGVTSDMHQRLDRWMSSLAPLERPAEATCAPEDEKLNRRLQALGYLR